MIHKDNLSGLETGSFAGTVGFSGLAVFGWTLSVTDIAILVSVLLSGLSFALHVWATLRRDRREQEAHNTIQEKHRVITAIEQGPRDPDNTSG